MKSVIPYFEAEYSFAYYKIPNFETDMISKVTFPREDNVILIATNFVHHKLFREIYTM